VAPPQGGDAAAPGAPDAAPASAGGEGRGEGWGEGWREGRGEARAPISASGGTGAPGADPAAPARDAPPSTEAGLAPHEARGLAAPGQPHAPAVAPAGHLPPDQAQTGPHPDAGARAAQQAAIALAASPEGRIELRLDPEELGPVRLALAPSDGALTVQISADRAETLDLMRRHADLLARELREAGYGAVNLDFGAGRDSGGAAGRGYPAPAPNPAPTPTPIPAPGTTAEAVPADAVRGALAGPASGLGRPGAGTLDLRL
jgi:hypothetical protein